MGTEDTRDSYCFLRKESERYGPEPESGLPPSFETQSFMDKTLPGPVGKYSSPSDTETQILVKAIHCPTRNDPYFSADQNFFQTGSCLG